MRMACPNGPGLMLRSYMSLRRLNVVRGLARRKATSQLPAIHKDSGVGQASELAAELSGGRGLL